MERMLDDKTLSLQPTTEDYVRVLKNKWPDRLVEIFNVARPETTINNVADALALGVLVEKVREFKEGQTSILPFLFPNDHLVKAFEDNSLAEVLSYGRTPENRIITVVKDWMYFVFKVTFGTGNGHKERKIGQETESQLRALRDEIATMLELNDEISRNLIAQKKAFGRPLSELVDEIDKLSFFENVWLKARAPEDVRSAIRAVSEAVEEFRKSKRVRRQAARILEEKREAFSANAREIEFIIRLWANLEQQAKSLQAETSSADLQTQDLFQDRGLLRYSFPEKPRAEIRELLEGSAFREARSRVVNACLIGVKNPANERDELVVAAAVLLALGMNVQLLELLERVDPHLPHFSLKIVYAELIFRHPLIKNRERGETLLEELRRDYERTVQKTRRADLAIGLGYLMFRLWRLKGGRVKWRPLDASEQSTQPRFDARKFVEDAITYAMQAYDGLRKSQDMKKKAYALNQYLYYLVEGAEDDRVPDMIEAAQMLTGFAGNAKVWQYRFDDTLARYFHRMATKKTNARDWLLAMESARDHIERACKRAYGDQIALGYLSKIGTAFQAGFGPSIKPKRPPRVIRVRDSKRAPD